MNTSVRWYLMCAAQIACLISLGADGFAGPPPAQATLIENNQVAVWCCHACVKVFPNDAVPAGRSQAATLFAARSETEAVQIVLRPKQAMSGLAATVSDFEGPMKLPASIATVRWVAYVPLKQASGPKGGTGLFPDPLPLRAPASIAANQNQPVWITVRVPVSAKPGDYRARVTFTANGATLCAVPLALHVWRFELPPTALKVMASARAGSRSRSPNDYIRNMTDHGVNTLGAHVPRPGQGWKEHDDQIAFLKSAGVRHFIMPLGWVKHERHRWPANAMWEMQGVPILPRDSPRALRIANEAGTDFDPKFRETLSNLIRQSVEHYRQLGILDHSFVRFIDEPLLEDQRTVDWIARVSKLIKENAPSLRILNTRSPVPALIPLTDIWSAHTDLWGPPYGAHIEAARQAGSEIWVYHNSIPLIDYSLMRVRTFAWALWKHRVTGTGAWWDLTAWAMTGQNPWEDTLYGPWNGGGVLLYPPRDEDEQGPIDSIRWEVWRDSLEDHRLLELATSLAKKHPGNAELKRLLAEADAVCPTWPGVRDLSTEPYWTDPMKLESLRHRMYEAVERIADN
ncbi:MAG: DUF4091 domain-containing protein [Verrucomicrobia bacterium]|nr:DUF4091 domain-containing protein [Verrucomicrobiota bacterium]